MKKIKSICCVITLVALILITWIVLRKISLALNCSDTIGTIKALEAALYSEMQNNPLGIIALSYKNEQCWQLLSKHAYDDLIANIGQKYNLDAPRGWRPSMPLKDIWGKRFAILYRRLSEKTQFVVISAGPDGNYGTTDDIESDAKVLKTIDMNYEDN